MNKLIHAGLFVALFATMIRAQGQEDIVYKANPQPCETMKNLKENTEGLQDLRDMLQNLRKELEAQRQLQKEKTEKPKEENNGKPIEP